jgi:4-hydroxy-tetrahydrodipicolinate synthase
MAIFKGAGVAVITPMKEDMSVNFEKLEQLIEDQITNATDCIVIAGTTGEASTLTIEEHLECIRTAVSAANKRIPVVAGTGSNSTQTALDLSVKAQQAGADGLLIVTPYYNKATQNGLKNHFTKIAAAVSIPVILYNIPGRTGCMLQPETTAAMAKEVDNIVGMKDATGDISHVLKVMQLTHGTFDMYSGEDGMVIPFMSAGGIGVISVLSNIVPRFTHDMVMNCLKGDYEKARDMQIKVLSLCEALFCEVNPIPVKAAVNLMGWEAGTLREPLTEMEPENVKRLIKAMEEFGIKLP